jgi:hypothetical protein
MAKIVKDNVLKELKKLYPKTGLIEISYEGSGDSFDDFFQVCAYSSYKKNKTLKEFSNKPRPDSSDKSKVINDIKNSKSFLSDLCFEMMDQHDEISFNDEGCSGVIYIDLDEEKIWIENSYYIRESVNSPDFIYLNKSNPDSENEGDW